MMAQSLQGVVYDEQNVPIPFTNIKVRNADIGTSADGDGKYYLDLDPGHYKIIYSAMGYLPLTIDVIIKEKAVYQNVNLQTSNKQLEELTVKAKRRDPAYDIIRKAIQAKENFRNQYQSSTCEVYIKAVEEKDKKEKKKKKNEAEEEEDHNLDEEDQVVDPFKQEQLRKDSILGGMKMTEVKLTRHTMQPNKVKEIRTGYQSYGGTFGLYYLSTVRSEIDFYNSLLYLNDLSETPIISPLHVTSVVNYKFKLEETEFHDGVMVYRIAVTPRKKGANATVEGTIWITDEIWNIRKLDLTLKKGNMIVYDEFRVMQNFEEIQDSIWVMTEQNFYYKSKTSSVDFEGHTEVLYSDYEINPTFGKKFFSNELGVTTAEAYERDSAYWETQRKKPLSEKEQQYVLLKDSLEKLYNSAAYLDSVDSLFNRITFAKVAYLGQGHRNRARKEEWYFGSIMDWWEPFNLGGMRIGPYIDYFKKLEHEQWFNIDGAVDMGFLNKDFNYRGRASVNYLPMHLGRVSVYGGHRYRMINQYDAYLNMLKRSNYIQADYAGIWHRIELLNGLYLVADATYTNRRPLPEGMKFGSLLDGLPDNNPVDFVAYQHFKTDLRLQFTPFQKYIREPYHKEVIGSKWPTFTLLYEKGWNGLFSSDVDYDYILMLVQQRIKVGTFGTSRYSLRAGKFLNTTDLRYIDYKFFRQSDPILYSNPLHSFQTLDTSLTTTKMYLEAHYIHHFNGSLTNNIPLIKKLRLKLVGGGGALWVQESNYRHAELFAGIERSFKVARERFRLGVYYVVGESNYFPIDHQVKFSIEFYDNRQGRWNF